MLYLVEFHLLAEGGRVGPIATSYRGSFRPDGPKSSFRDAAVFLFKHVKELAPGETATVLLQPLRPEVWPTSFGGRGYAFGCYEGDRQVGEATVLGVYDIPVYR